jgi:uncharacterized membrane protein YphA (DoxX/SURF4 family)
MILSFIPDSIVMAGLVGFAFALVIAWYQNNWETKVLLLLALRIAIGWQFFFEGLHKVNSHLVGKTETSKPFTSEPYFNVAPTAFGEIMRKKFEDAPAIIDARVTPVKDVKPADFKAMSVAEQAALCPSAVAKEFDDIVATAQESLKQQFDEARKVLEAEAATATSESLKQHAERKLKDKQLEKEARESSLSRITSAKIEEAKAKYAAWICGVTPRDTKVVKVNDPVPFTAPQRLEYLEKLRKGYTNDSIITNEKRSEGLGRTNGIDVKRAAEVRADVIAAESDLAKDALAFSMELKKEMLGWESVLKSKSEGKMIDEFTMWFITIIGGCMIFGLFTRVSCVLAAGFLIMTYLSHPPFPWYPLPPNTEGNPLFINKNAIEAIALLVLACYPTGRWLGLDAILSRVFSRKRQG